MRVDEGLELGDGVVEDVVDDVVHLQAPGRAALLVPFAEACLDPLLCTQNPSCAFAAPDVASIAAQQFFRCTLPTSSGQDFALATNGQSYCASSVLVETPPDLRCINPRIAFPPGSPVTVEPDPATVHCRVTLPAGMLQPADEHHVLLLDAADGTTTSQPADSSSFNAAKPMLGRARSTRQVTKRPTFMGSLWGQTPLKLIAMP